MPKTVLITGTSSGVGRAAARLFAKEGWNVVATMRAPEQEMQLGARPNVLVERLDVRDKASIKQAIAAGIARFGRIDALINNAGFSLFGTFESIAPERAEEQIAVNLTGVMDTTRAILPHFRRNKGGLIINVSSRAGLAGLPMLSLYCASKFALEGFSEALSFELAALHIAVKIVTPIGGSNTGFSDRMGSEHARNTPMADYEDFSARVFAANAKFAEMWTGRTTSAEDIARVICEAATDTTGRLRYIVGHDIPPILKSKKEMEDLEYTEFMRSLFT